MDGVTAALPFQAAYAPADEELAAKFLADVPRDGAAERRIDARARRLIEAIRAKIGGLGGVEDFLHAFSLSTKEGLALMVLAEALLRVPDAATADRLIEDKLSAGRLLDGAPGPGSGLDAGHCRARHPSRRDAGNHPRQCRASNRASRDARGNPPGDAASRVAFCDWPQHRGGAAPRQGACEVFLFLRHARRRRAHGRRC